MKETGTVKELKGKNAVVEIKRNSACGNCGACHISKDQSIMLTTAKNPVNAKRGETVEVEMEFVSLFSAAFIMYGLPLIGFLFGSCLAYFLVGILNPVWDQVLTSFFTGILLTAFIYLIIRYFDQKGRFKSKYQPVITGIIETKKTEITPIKSRMGLLI